MSSSGFTKSMRMSGKRCVFLEGPDVFVWVIRQLVCVFLGVAERINCFHFFETVIDKD